MLFSRCQSLLKWAAAQVGPSERKSTFWELVSKRSLQHLLLSFRNGMKNLTNPDLHFLSMKNLITQKNIQVSNNKDTVPKVLILSAQIIIHPKLFDSNGFDPTNSYPTPHYTLMVHPDETSFKESWATVGSCPHVQHQPKKRNYSIGSFPRINPYLDQIIRAKSD